MPASGSSHKIPSFHTQWKAFITASLISPKYEIPLVLSINILLKLFPTAQILRVSSWSQPYWLCRISLWSPDRSPQLHTLESEYNFCSGSGSAVPHSRLCLFGDLHNIFWLEQSVIVSLKIYEKLSAVISTSWEIYSTISIIFSNVSALMKISSSVSISTSGLELIRRSVSVSLGFYWWFIGIILIFHTNWGGNIVWSVWTSSSYVRVPLINLNIRSV